MRKFFIFGDSHAGTLLRTAKGMKLDHAGGSIMAGMHMNDTFFEVKDGVFRMLGKLGSERLATRLSEAGLGDNLLDIDLPFLSTLGFNTHNFYAAFDEGNFAIQPIQDKWFVSAACFEAAVIGSRQGTFAFYATLRDAGRSVFAVRSPQRFTAEQAPVWNAYEEVIARKLTAMGIPIIDVRAKTTDADGVLRPEFASPDPEDRIHANNKYGKIVLRRFEEMLAA